MERLPSTEIKKQSNFKKIITIPLTILFFIINVLGFYTGNLVYYEACKAQTSRGIPNMYDTYKCTFNEKRFKTLSKENITIQSKYGYNIKGIYLINPIPTKNSVVIVHGIKGTRWESMKYADLYLDKGFNVLVYDSRYHGLTGGNDVTFGYCEKYDLDRCIDWLYKKNNGGIIGAHGESLGAATILLHSQLNLNKNRVKFYVADCPYSDLKELLIYRMNKDLHISNRIISNALIFYSGTCALIRSGFTYNKVSPINAIKNVETPIMFIHGDIDYFIPKKMSEDMYKEKSGPKELYIAPAAGHAQAYLYNKKEYTKKLYQFIDKYVPIIN